jgi:hypothetical protein
MEVTFKGSPQEVVHETLQFLALVSGHRGTPTPAPVEPPAASPAPQAEEKPARATRASKKAESVPAAQETAPTPAPEPVKEEPKAAEPVKEEPPLEDGAFRSAASKKIFDRLAALKKEADLKTDAGKTNVVEIQKFVFSHLKYGKFGEVPPSERRDVLAKLDTILGAYA